MQVMTLKNILKLNLTLTASKIHVMEVLQNSTVNCKQKQTCKPPCLLLYHYALTSQAHYCAVTTNPIPNKRNNTMYCHKPQDPICQKTVTALVFLVGSTIFSISTAEALLFKLLQDGTET